MRIHDAYTKLDRTTVRSAPTPGAGPAKSDATSAAGAASSTGVAVKLSAEAISLSQGSARIQELKAKVQNGTFSIDAHAIASKLVGDEG